MKHELKIEPKYFEQKLSGQKNWEIRLNDRGYKEGDILHLREWEAGSYTGREIYQTVESLFQNEKYLQPEYALMTGTVFIDNEEENEMTEKELTEQEVIKSAENMKKWCRGHFKEDRCDCPFANGQYCKLHRTIPRFWDMPKPRPRISTFEYEFLKRLDSKFEYVTRDKDEKLYAFSKLPAKREDLWNSGTRAMELCFSDFLTFIKWEDSEPTGVKELIKEYEEFQNAQN